MKPGNRRNLLISAFAIALLAVALYVYVGQRVHVTQHVDVAQRGISFDWRKQTGEFPSDKPGYLILCTEDALTYSKVLPEFVKQKEAMGFYVYVATEKDYGTGKMGNAQAAQVRVWLRDFQKRTHAKYALLIGDSSPRSSDLPSPTIPDGEHGGLEASYCDLNGKWVDLYLNTKEKDTRSGWVQMCAGSLLIGKALKAGGPRHDDLIVSRISYCGTEIGNSAYDLDRILEKTIRYERDTVAGKNLDWRGRILSITSNYGAGSWDAPLLSAAEREGGSYEYHSSAGWIGNIAPENVFDGNPLNAQLMNQTRRRGMLCTMSHGYNRGGEGIANQWDIFREIDDRWPASVGFTACTGFALADNCNMGQTWIRKGGIFAVGTGWSGNNGCRVPLQTRQLEERLSVGEAARNMVVQYGDPSLHVLPAKGQPVCALQIQPALAGHYEERTLEPGRPIKPLTETYTLTNRSKEPMSLSVETDVTWLTLSSDRFALAPGETAKVTATSNWKVVALAPGMHVANIRFCRVDGQRDERRFAMKLSPISLLMAYSFDAAIQSNRFPNVANATQPDAWHDNTSLWLVDVTKGPHWNAFVKLGAKVPGYTPEPQGKVGGALRLNSPKPPFSRGLTNPLRWCGASVSLWFRLDALPQPKQNATILAAPFALSADAAGALSFAQGDKPFAVGKVATGTWHFIQFRTDVDAGKIRAVLDGGREVLAAAKTPLTSALALGTGTCTVDEIKVWSGELSDNAISKEFAAARKPFQPVAPATAVAYADDGVFRAPKGLPADFNFNDAKAQLDVSKILADNHLDCSLREAPDWLVLKDGVLSINPGTDFDRIDFGGYDFFLVLKAPDGRVCESPIKARIPVPAVRIKISRAKDGMISFVNAGDRYGKPDRPLAKGVIRYTTDGLPVKPDSTAYEKPFKVIEGMKITARFFYLGEYPMAPVTSASEFGVSREKWKAVAVSGKPTLPAAGNAFDALPETAWVNKGETLPQFFAWDMGESVTLTALSCHSTIRDATGRIDEYVLYASDDGKAWHRLQSGNIADSPIAQRIQFTKPCATRYLKLEAISLHAGKDMVITELEGFSR